MLKKMLFIGLTACSSVAFDSKANIPEFSGKDICSTKEYNQLDIIISKHKDILPLINLLKFHAESNQFKEAIKCIDKAIKIATKKVKNKSDKSKILTFLFIIRALNNLSLKNYKPAIKDCTNALKHDKDKACAYYLKAIAYLKLNKPATALSYIKTAAKKGSRHAKYIVKQNPEMYKYIDEAEEK